MAMLNNQMVVNAYIQEAWTLRCDHSFAALLRSIVQTQKKTLPAFPILGGCVLVNVSTPFQTFWGAAKSVLAIPMRIPMRLDNSFPSPVITEDRSVHPEAET